MMRRRRDWALDVASRGLQCLTTHPVNTRKMERERSGKISLTV